MLGKIKSVLALALAAVALVIPITASADRSDWREMTVGQYEIFSTLGDYSTRSVARQLQGFEETVGAWLQTGDRLPDTPTRIYLLSSDDFRHYASPSRSAGGFFQRLRFGNVMVIDASANFDQVRAAVFHEFSHYVQANTGAEGYPPWYTEGYAELFSGFKLQKNRVVMGSLPYGTTPVASEWIPVDRLLAVTQSDPEYVSERLAPQFYGESWALVHLLLFDDKSLSTPTLQYLADMNAGFSEPEAFASAFPFDKATLDARLRKFVDGRRVVVKVATLSNPVLVDAAPLTRLSAARAETEFVRLIWQLDKPNLVDELVDKATPEEKADPAARALLARIAVHEGKSFDLDDLAATLAKGGTDEPQERIDVADALLYKGTDDAASRQALLVLGDLVHSNAAPVEAVELWAYAASRCGVSTPDIIAKLEPLTTRVPHDTSVLRSLARAYETVGDKSKSRDAYNRIILVSHSPEERHWAQQEADSARLQAAPSPSLR